MEIKLVVSQSGSHKCLICNNIIDWNLEVKSIRNTELEHKWGTLLTEIITIPDNRVFFNTVGIDNIEVSISCPHCSYTHKTDPLKMIKA